jgi:hypothetical protein
VQRFHNELALKGERLSNVAPAPAAPTPPRVCCATPSSTRSGVAPLWAQLPTPRARAQPPLFTFPLRVPLPYQQLLPLRFS